MDRPTADRTGARTRTDHDSLARLEGHVEAYENDIDRVLLTEDEIQATVRRLGDEITEDYRGRSPLLIGVLKGAFVMMADLSRHIRLPVEFDFMAVASYGAATKTSGVVRILKDLDHDIEHAKEEQKKAQGKMLQPWPEGLAARISGTWQTDRLGTVVVSTDPKDPKVVRADAGEWSTRLGYGKADDGVEKLYLLDPPLAGFSFRIDGKDLVIEFGQDVFRFVKK